MKSIIQYVVFSIIFWLRPVRMHRKIRASDN